MKQRLFLLIFSVGFALPFFAQHPLQRNVIMFRANDTIVKQQVQYKDPGRIGTNVLWDFGKLSPVDEQYQLIYTKDKRNDSIVGIEHRTRYYYQLREDSLLIRGFENATTKMDNIQPELLMKFPLKYLAETHAFYEGRGEYCKQLHIDIAGTIDSKVDAYGMMMIPNGDTLRHVMRVKIRKLIVENTRPIAFAFDELQREKPTNAALLSEDSIRYRLTNDTSVVVVENYKWYAAGYRYPIFETVRTGKLRDSLRTEYFSTAFFYPPDQHRYLETDTANIDLRERLRTKGNNGDGGINDDDNQGGSPLNPFLDFSYNLYPNPVQHELTIEYYLSEDATVSYALYTMNGQAVYLSPAQSQMRGVYSDRVDMNAYPKGEYVLRMQVGENVFNEKIIKR